MIQTVLALLVIVAAVALILRRIDVRLVLVAGAFLLFLLAGKVSTFVGVLVKELGNPATVVPIGSALGFAYVLKQTGCDEHLVRLLLRPIRRVRWLLVPGGVAAGYLVNTAIVSQTGAAAVVGPVLVPLLRAGGVSPVTAGAILLLGCSMGGELFNPGAVEVVTLSTLTKVDEPLLIERISRLNLSACAVALAAFWWLAARRGRRDSLDVAGPAEDGAGGEVPPFRVHLRKAVVPVIPLALLFAAPGFVKLPAEMAALNGPATILAAMLIGVVVAGAVTPGEIGKLAASFFEGAGFAYTKVISLIVTATVFAEGVKANGLIDLMTAGLSQRPGLGVAVGIAAPWSLATLTGTGIAPAVAVMKVMVPTAGAMGLDPIRLGALTSMAAHFGRTMSPAAAVVMMCATLTGADPLALVRRVAPPLLIGGVVLLVAGWLGWG